jgi:hypothetical protein
MEQPNPSPKKEQADKAPTENTCAEGENPLTLNQKSLWLFLVALRRSLAAALQACDRLLDFFKSK